MSCVSKRVRRTSKAKARSGCAISIKNCLRMRPERIIVGEVRGPEAFDLLQAMNTGHDGSMGTLHANSPREALSRLESMIMQGGYALPIKTIREMICGSVDVIVQASRLRDGSRKITHITEVLGMEEETVTLQNLLVYEITGEDADGKLIGRHRSTGIARPRFWERAEYYSETERLARALAANRKSRTTTAIRLGDRQWLSSGLLAYLVPLLAALAFAVVVYALAYPYFSGDRQKDRRLESVAGVRGAQSLPALPPKFRAAARNPSPIL